MEKTITLNLQYTFCSSFLCRLYVRLWIFCLAFPLFFVLLGVNVRAAESCEVKIYTRNSKVNLREIKTFFRTADLLISRILPAEKKKRGNPSLSHYAVVLLDEKHFNKFEVLDTSNKELRFYLPEKTSDWIGKDRITSRIILSILLKRSGAVVARRAKLPPWLVYGVLAKVQRRLSKANIPGMVTFPGVHMLLTASSTPDLFEIAFSSLKPEDGAAYKIFLETSEILLAAVLRLPQSRNAIKDIVDLSVDGIPARKTFDMILGKKVYSFLDNTTDISKLGIVRQNHDELKTWLNDYAILKSVNPFKPGNARFAEKQFSKIKIVKYLSKSEKGSKAEEIRYCKVADLFIKRKEIKNFTFVVKNKEIEFSRLEFAVPIQMQTSIYNMKKYLRKLRTDSSFKFKKAYVLAEQNFYDEVEKYYELETYLGKMELRFVPEAWRYRTEFQEISKSETYKRKRWPALTKYLDLIETQTNLK